MSLIAFLAVGLILSIIFMFMNSGTKQEDLKTKLHR